MFGIIKRIFRRGGFIKILEKVIGLDIIILVIIILNVLLYVFFYVLWCFVFLF